MLCPCGKEALKRRKLCWRCHAEKSANRYYSAEDKRLMRACWEERKRLLREAEQFSLKHLAEKFGGTPQSVHHIVTYRNAP